MRNMYIYEIRGKVVALGQSRAADMVGTPLDQCSFEDLTTPTASAQTVLARYSQGASKVIWWGQHKSNAPSKHTHCFCPDGQMVLARR